ncbi:hypothetical protein TRFO_23175 [Tritrichomonas foetus]|uniref:BEACH domain-containing protein n=1 Tax=Tritrichomonas foetus TaxID=1144522 RepID=A0A1J4KAD8_9EUKA|nr:hypothetical protein TRFO_23175 [Tritrichomonas foetus]|eukprot:OHT08401.1 hypothetical protein TRFO_23175 [Tritrichomonas foetus]
MNIFTTLKNLLKDSVELQKQMLEINGFHLIAHFLRNIDPKRINISVWNNIESFENICLLKELLKSFYDSIIINFKPWLDANDEVLFLVIKKWIQIDVKLFISCLTFPAFCHVIYHQFHDRKISNVTIKNNIVHLLLNVSKLFSEKEMSILCQLVGKMATDVTSALSMLQTVRVITTDNPNLHSIAVNVMVNDERLMHSRNPEILCGIIQLFAQNDLNYIAILLRRQIEFQRDYIEIDVFLSYLCAALVGKSSNTLEDLFYLDISKHTISPPLIPFVLAFSFQASTNQIEKVTNFLLQILSDKECLHFIANSIDSLTLFLLISYSIVLSNRLVKCLVDIITTNIMLFSDAYLIYDILAEDLGHDLHDYQNAISCSVLLKILENKQETSPVDISQIIDIVVNSMCYGVNRSVFDILKNVNTFEPKEKERRSSYIIPPQTSQILRESRERRSSFTQSPEMFIQLSYIIQKKFALNNMFEKLKNNCFKNQKVKYGLVYKKESTTFIWADTKTAELLMQFFDDPNLKPISSAQLCVILCFLCHSHFVSSSKKICYYLNLVAEKYDIGCSFITPLLVEVSSHIEDFTAAELFLAKFQSEIGLSSEFYESATQVMESFVNSLHPISNISCKLGKLFNFEFDPLNIMNIDSYFLDLQQKDLTRNTLREKMYRKLRPIYTDVHRRYNLIDNHFRPYLLINTERFNFELIDSPIVEEHLTNEIWSARCQRCKLDIKIDGFFIITENGIRFSTTKGKSIFILKSNVRCVFWNYYHHKPLSFTFITRKGKSFLFKFDEDIKREDVVANLKKVEMINCSFFQENEPSIEIGRLELTQRWRKREISNFDYILWLNMLSGRTFLDSESYPIFPFIFASYENQCNIRDFSRNISIYLSKENAKQLRERRMSDLDPYRSFLFSQAFSTSELIKKFLGSISQFHCETYFTSYKEIFERITEGKLQCELPPEFFFMPEIFEKWKEFPKYAPNASVFMMKNLKALETEEVSMTLHKWIDIIWGASQNLNCMYDPDLSSTVWDFYKLNNVSLNKPDTELNYKSNKFGNLGRSRNTNNKSNKKILNANSKDKDQCNNHFSVERITEIEQKLKEKGQLPKKLFAGPHPARGTCIIPHTENLSFKLENNSGVLAIGTNQENSKGRNAEIFFFHKNEKISICNLKQTNKIKSTKIPIDKSTSFEFINFFQSHLCFVPIGINKPLCYDITTKTLYANNSESPHLCGVSCMDSLSNFFVTGSYDSSIVSWSKNSNTKTILPLKTLLAHRKPIKQIKIQEEMRVLLSIDETGLLSISIFPFLKLIKSIQTGILNVDFIEMTRNSIICFKGSEAKNFTANGTENGRRNFGFDVVCECSIESRKRTDIVAISTSLNEIITINAISLQAISLLEHHWCLIIRMKYSQELDSLFCTTEDNEVLIIPISE